MAFYELILNGQKEKTFDTYEEAMKLVEDYEAL